MNLNFTTIATLFRAELRMLLRDKRILTTSVLLPLLITPLMFLGSSWSLKHREQKLSEMTYHYAVIGPQADMVRTLISDARRRLAGQKNKDKQFNFEEVSRQDPKAALNKGELQLVLEGPGTNEAAATDPGAKKAVQAPSRKKASNERADGGETSVPGAPVVRIVFRGDHDDSGTACSRLQDDLNETRRLQRNALLKSKQFPIAPAQLAVVSEQDLASKRQVAGLALGRTITLVLLIFILTGSAVVATDSLAGEKERGTLETLLTTAAGRVEILAAKHLVILAVALLITIIQAANLLVYISFKLMPVPANLSAAVPPWVALLLFFLYLPMAALVANVLLLISGHARSYKEAQMYFTPALLVAVLPAIAPMLPGLTLRSAVVLLPIANLGLAAKEILTGVFDWPMIALAWLVTAGTAVWTTRLGVRFLSAESLITAAEVDATEFTGGPALFERRVWRWFAVLWALLVLINNYYERADVRLQVAINLVVLFFGASLLMIRCYRLNPGVALALRAPKPAVWLGVLFAVPGGLLTALLAFKLTDFLLPVSTKTLEGFSETVFPPGIPAWQLVFFIAVMPGIFEEIAFRGLLLHGLRRRLHPAALAVVVGLVFGFFHVVLFRFVPTAVLGMMLAAVTMLTGSIFPAMLWHALNNATGLLAYQFKFPETELDPVCYAIGVGMLAVAFWVFWRNRTPYPGLRPWKKRRTG